jgi:hypothetical protein
METNKEKAYRVALEKIVGYTAESENAPFIKNSDFKKNAINLVNEALSLR